jgi:hypothetical protein
MQCQVGAEVHREINIAEVETHTEEPSDEDLVEDVNEERAAADCGEWLEEVMGKGGEECNGGIGKKDGKKRDCKLSEKKREREVCIWACL